MQLTLNIIHLDMTTKEKIIITVRTQVHSSIDKVWKLWTTPEHIVLWNAASPDWHTTKSENDLRVGGRFSSRMEAKDKSFGFDFGGMYDLIIPSHLIQYTMDDGRKVKIEFNSEGNNCTVIESFEAETENSIELQQGGWQAILDSFKNYVEEK